MRARRRFRRTEIADLTGVELARPRRLHTRVEIGHYAPRVRHGVQIRNPCEWLEHADLLIRRIRSPLAAESATDSLVKHVGLENGHEITLGEPVKDRRPLIQLLVGTVGPVNRERDGGAPVLPAAVEELTQQSARRQEPLIPHVVAIRLAAEPRIRPYCFAGHFREILRPGLFGDVR